MNAPLVIGKKYIMQESLVMEDNTIEGVSVKEVFEDGSLGPEMIKKRKKPYAQKKWCLP